MKSTTYFKAIATATALGVLMVTSASAAGQYGEPCVPAYGATDCQPTVNFLINKRVARPGTTDQFVENLGINDVKFTNNSSVAFQITFTNNGTSTLSKVVLKDVLPSELIYVSGGIYNATDRTVTFEEKDVKAGESRLVTLNAKVASASTDQSIVCPVNKAVAQVDGKEAVDNAQFCIEKTVLGQTKGGKAVFPAPSVTESPATGPGAISLLLMPAGAIGYFLRKKAISK